MKLISGTLQSAVSVRNLEPDFSFELGGYGFGNGEIPTTPMQSGDYDHGPSLFLFPGRYGGFLVAEKRETKKTN